MQGVVKNSVCLHPTPYTLHPAKARGAQSRVYRNALRRSDLRLLPSGPDTGSSACRCAWPGSQRRAVYSHYYTSSRTEKQTRGGDFAGEIAAFVGAANRFGRLDLPSPVSAAKVEILAEALTNRATRSIIMFVLCGSSSTVECLLPKQDVASSSLVSRSL